MAARPSLPEHRNPMLEEHRAPSHEILVERRCLGQTELKVKPGQVGTSNATKLENLGVLDYAHLRVPLPKDLTGSGIFQRQSDRKWPTAYFLMRRSSDGFISATGMFKAAFPFAQQEEETTEKEYIKSLEEAASEEVAGNVWIDPGKALELAEEYGIKLWIAALLDPEPITHGVTSPDKAIRSPPTYHMKEMANGIGRTPDKGTATRRTRNARSLRSESPTATSKAAPSPRKKATPRKPRDTRKGKSGTLSSVDEDYVPEDAVVNGDKTEKVKIEVENTVLPGATGEEQVEATKAKFTFPPRHSGRLDETPAQMMAEARKMIDEAKKLDGTTVSSKKGKRKAEEMLEGDEDEAELEALARPTKRQRHLQVELRKEKIRRKAATGIAATLAIGAFIPYLISFLS